MSINEARLRRILHKQGYQLHKSRARNWSLHNQLGYIIIKDNCVMAGADYDLSLDDVREFAEN